MKLRKNKVLPLFLLIAVVVLAGAVAAGTCTFVSPASSATVSGASVVFNISTTAYAKNCTITGTSSASGGTWTVGTALNNSQGAVNSSNVTASSAGIRDAADWSFSATCVNNSGATVDTCTRTGIKVNNTVPVFSGCTINGQTASSGTVGSSSNTVVCTVKNATSCNAYWKTNTALAFSTSATSRTDMSLNAFTASDTYGSSGTTLTARITGAADSAKNVYFDCTDGADTVTSTAYAISAEGFSTTQKPTTQTGTSPLSNVNFNSKKTKGMAFLLLVGGATVLLLIGAAVYTKKKRR